MPGTTDEPIHPGAYVRQNVIPKDMTVTKAAELLGIGRPALSNFLNGKAALSREMASRIGRTFGADIETLLDLQARYERRNEATRRPVVAGRYASILVAIRAADIDGWSHRIDARHKLAALLRGLVHTTGHELTRVDFPAFDNAERRGWDGVVETSAPTPWIPEGHSGWEFGCDRNATRKANKDYTARLTSVPMRERRETTFVFVTPRNCPQKNRWAKDKAILGEWKDVRAYDASDLEQWLEQSAQMQVWLAEQIGIPVSGYRSLDRCWADWADTCDPVLSPTLFDPSVQEFSDRFKKWLTEPPARPFVVAADSRDEALAFLFCLFGSVKSDTDEPGTGALVFDIPEAMQRFRACNAALGMAVVHDARVEREIGNLYRRCHCVIVRLGNDVYAEPDIRLGLPNSKEFSAALKSMGLSEDRIQMLARESGRSPTVLRRRLSNVPAVRAPAWARDTEKARKLLPTALIGAWHRASSADREVVRLLARANEDYDVEAGVTALLALEDSPLWSAGEYRGVVSRIDALFGVHEFVTGPDLDNFFFVAECVLSETDPALDLPEDERWRASIHGKVRDHSAALREGIREMLVLLSIHGDTLFRSGLGVDLETRISSFIHRLLTPLTIDKLLSHQDDLPDYAEAAPATFLTLIEADLQEPEPAVFGLLKPADGGPFGRCLRTGLLWALECLAWNHLDRVSLILARLSTIAIDDNWANKPIGSLESLYRSWLPQTTASPAERMQSLETLVRRFRDVGWQVCIAQLSTGPQFAMPNYRPRWRDDASGAGQGVTLEQFHEFTRESLGLVLAWPNPDQRKLGALVELLHGLPAEDQIQIWDLIDAWADAEADDKAKAWLRERIRRCAFTRRGRRHGVQGEARKRARAAYDRLEPHNPVVRHSWLFANSWIDPSAAEETAEKFDHEKHAEKIREHRSTAMREIWAESGFEGVIALLADCGAPIVIGEMLEPCIPGGSERSEFVNRCLSVTDRLHGTAEWCLRGFLRSVDDDERVTLLAAVAHGADTEQIVRLYRCAPCRQHTWRLLDRYDKRVKDRYWQVVQPEWNRYEDAELIEMIGRLLDAGRPHAAFHVAHLDWSRVETSQLKRLLFDMASADPEPEEHYRLEAYKISEALSELDGRRSVSREEMVRLEFTYVLALDHSEHGIPNLERSISESPLAFVQILALLFRRDDGRQDPPEWHTEDTEKRAALGSAAYRLLGRISRVPGTGDGDGDGDDIDAEMLPQRVIEIRRLCAEYGRAQIGDQYIGQILSRAQADEDGIEPSPAVCEAMERVGSQDIASGFTIGTFNARGVVTRAIGEGGRQERELAEKYRSWARQRSPHYPFVGGILESIADDYDRQAIREDADAQIEQRLGR